MAKLAILLYDTDYRDPQGQSGGPKSLLVSGGARIFRLQKDKNYINLTVLILRTLLLFSYCYSTRYRIVQNSAEE